MTIEEQFKEITEIYYSMPTKERNYFNPNDSWKDTPKERIFYRKVIPQKGFIEVCRMDKGKDTRVSIDYAVAPNFRGQGIASSLLVEALEYCQKNGATSIYADAHFQNKKSKMLLKKYNFYEAYRVDKMITFKKELEKNI